MFRIGAQQVGTAYTANTSYIAPPAFQNTWSIIWSHRTGGLKKQWILGADGCPVTSIKFELNLGGCGAGEIDLAKIDFPIDPDDTVKIFYTGVAKYQGWVKTSPDPKGGQVQLNAMKLKLSRALVSYNSTDTLDNILKTIITGLNSGYNLYYSTSMINTGAGATTYALVYVNVYANTVMDDLITRMTGRYWGVDENGFVFVRPLSSTLQDTLNYVDDPAYTGIQVTTDYSGIDITRAYVVCKANSGAGTNPVQTIGAGPSTVGYPGSSYPYNAALPIETIVGVKEGIVTIPDYVVTADGLAYAYTMLGNQSYLTSITVSGVRLEKYNPPNPIVTRKIQIQDSEEYQLALLDACDNNTWWKPAQGVYQVGTTLDTTHYTEGTGSVSFVLQTLNYYAVWMAPQGNFVTSNGTYLDLMLMSNVGGDGLTGAPFLTINIYGVRTPTVYGAGLYGAAYYGTGADPSVIASYVVQIATVNIWQLVQVALPASAVISQVQFLASSYPATSATINIDRMQVFQQDRKIYQNNIVQVNFDLTPQKTDISMKLSSYDLLANSTIMNLNKYYKIVQQQIKQ